MTPAGYNVATPSTVQQAATPKAHHNHHLLHHEFSPLSEAPEPLDETTATPEQNPSPSTQSGIQQYAEEEHVAAQRERERHCLIESLNDCAAFVVARSSRGLVSMRSSLETFHQDMANSILAAALTHTPRNMVDVGMDLQPFKDGFDILFSTYENDESGVQQVLQYIDREMFADVLKACLNLAAGHGTIGVARVFLAVVSDINVRNSEGRTCLHVASLRNHPTMVEFLVQQGASVHITSRDAETPWSAIGGEDSHEAVSQILIRAGACVDHAMPGGMNALYQAAAGGQVDRVRVLLRRGANPISATPYLWAPLVSLRLLHISQGVPLTKLEHFAK
jgi:hypothetical protein